MTLHQRSRSDRPEGERLARSSTYGLPEPPPKVVRAAEPVEHEWLKRAPVRAVGGGWLKPTYTCRRCGKGPYSERSIVTTVSKECFGR